MYKKKILATLMICILLPQTTLSAKENPYSDAQERTIVSSEVYDTVTDTEDLIELAVSQSKETESSNYDLLSEFNTVSDIVATQVVAERVYSDGSTEKEVRTDGFILTDIDTNEVLRSSTYDSYLPKATNSYGVSAYHTAYFTIKYGDNLVYTIKPGRIESSVNYSTVKVTNFVHGIFCEQQLGGYYQDSQQTIGVPSVNTNYYVYPTNTSWYIQNMTFDLYTYMKVYLSNGSSMYLEVNLTAVIND